VGFPGEMEAQFQRTLKLVEQLRMDKVHCAAYSTRPGTIADRTMEDDIPQAEKTSRRERIDALQQSILTEINAELVGSEFEVLVEARNKGKWQGRTRSNKLVFFPIAEPASNNDDGGDRLGQLVNVKVERAGPWSLQGQPK